MISKQHYLSTGETKLIKLGSRAVYITLIANGTNQASIEVRKNSELGQIVIRCNSKQSLQSPEPVYVDTDVLWATVSGIDAALSISEHVA